MQDECRWFKNKFFSARGFFGPKKNSVFQEENIFSTRKLFVWHGNDLCKYAFWGANEKIVLCTCNYTCKEVEHFAHIEYLVLSGEWCLLRYVYMYIDKCLWFAAAWYAFDMHNDYNDMHSDMHSI